MENPFPFHDGKGGDSGEGRGRSKQNGFKKLGKKRTRRSLTLPRKEKSKLAGPTSISHSEFQRGAYKIRQEKKSRRLKCFTVWNKEAKVKGGG